MTAKELSDLHNFMTLTESKSLCKDLILFPVEVLEVEEENLGIAKGA
jgi:hypothetical protein